MLGFNDIIQIILVSALNFCAMIINAVFIWIIRHKYVERAEYGNFASLDPRKIRHRTLFCCSILPALIFYRHSAILWALWGPFQSLLLRKDSHSRAQNVAGAAVIVYIGPCTVIHTKICHFFYGIYISYSLKYSLQLAAAYVELVAQSMHLLTLSFAFRLWMINSESMIHQPTISRKLWILSAFVSTWSLLNTVYKLSNSTMIIFLFSDGNVSCWFVYTCAWYL